MVLPIKPLWLVAGGIVALAVYSGSAGQAIGNVVPTSTTACTFTVNADTLNVRSGPEMSQPIIAKYKQGTEVHAQHDLQNGFRKLSEGRWAAEQYLAAVSGSTCS